MTEFLTKEEIIELTGKKRSGDQIAWLAKRGWIFETNAIGRPVICREYVRAKLGCGNQVAKSVGQEPNWAALQ